MVYDASTNVYNRTPVFDPKYYQGNLNKLLLETWLRWERADSKPNCVTVPGWSFLRRLNFLGRPADFDRRAGGAARLETTPRFRHPTEAGEARV